MIRPQSITTYPCSIIITLWQLLGVGSALAKLTCNPVDFFVVVLVVMEHFYHLFACHQIKKKLPRSFKMGSPLYYIPLLQKEIFSHRHWTHYKTDDDSSMQYYFMKCILLQHFDFTQLWLQATSRTLGAVKVKKIKAKRSISKAPKTRDYMYQISKVMAGQLCTV